MQCPYCNTKLTAGNICEKCGSDIKIFKKLYMISNRCYNDGLEKAKARDLSGAVTSLINSLKINKRNTLIRILSFLNRKILEEQPRMQGVQFVYIPILKRKYRITGQGAYIL